MKSKKKREGLNSFDDLTSPRTKFWHLNRLNTRRRIGLWFYQRLV